MAFVNEFVSADEILEFELDSVMREFDPQGWSQGIPVGFRHTWTIDRDAKCYLIMVRKFSVVGPSGNDTPTSGRLALLSVGGRRFLFSIERTAASSVKAADRPFRIQWKFGPQLDGRGHDWLTAPPSVLTKFKAALISYGHFGAWIQVPDTQVGFDF
jgi:hypothetical protein